MDSLHRYEINLKKDDLFINLSSDDVYFISKQMDKWCRVMLDDSYVPVTLAKSMPVRAAEPAPQPVYAAPPTPQPVEIPAMPVQPAYQAPPVAPQQTPLPAAVTPQPEPVVMPQFEQPQPVYQAPPVPQFSHPAAHDTQPAPQAPPVQPQASLEAPLGVQAVQLPMSQPQPVPMPEQPQPVYQQAPAVQAVPRQPLPPTPAVPAYAPVVPPEPVLDDTVKDDFEAVMDSLMKDLEEADAPAAPQTFHAGNGHTPARPGFSAPFEPQTPQLPVPKTVPEGMETLADLCDRSHAGSSEDYLLLSAYYLSQFERAGQFSLKRINSTLVKSGLTPINHSVLETTLSRGYLSMVPDLTGMAEVTEYVLTPDGLQAATRLL